MPVESAALKPIQLFHLPSVVVGFPQELTSGDTNFTGAVGTVYPEVNSCGNPTTTDGKWINWMGFNAADSTGMVGTWSGSRYVGTGQYRPSANSTMNSLFGNDKNTSFNPARVTTRVGQDVVWRFEDNGLNHTVSADDASFDSGRQGSGEFKRAFTKPGEIAYHCNVHARMKGTVVVTS